MSAVEKVIMNAKSDKKGLLFNSDDIDRAIAKDLSKSPVEYLGQRGCETVPEKTKKTTKIMDSHVDGLILGVQRLIEAEQDLKGKAKNVSTSVRKSADELKGGLERIQKQADFNSLERYVLLLERAAIAMTTLGEIERTGKLEKIANALK